MKKKIFYALAAIALIGGLVWTFMPKPMQVQAATVSVGRFVRSVQEDGKTRLRDRYVISAPLAGRLARVAVKEGDTLKQGERVATLWPAAPALLDARTQQELRARIGASQAALSRAYSGVDRAIAALEQARNDLKRSQTLAQQGFVSPERLESERLSLRLREKELDSAQQDAHAARHELEQARAAVQRFDRPQASASAWDIKTPVAAKVLKILQQSEGMVSAGAPILELGDPTQLEVVADVLTEEAALIAPGAAVELDGGEGLHQLQGRVRLVEPAAFTKVSALGVQEQRVNVVIDITSPPEQWRALGDGFRVDARIVVQVIEQAITAPVSAVFSKAGGTALYAIENGRAREHAVTVAARNGTEALLSQGIAPGARVIMYPPSTLKEGQRVKERG